MDNQDTQVCVQCLFQLSHAFNSHNCPIPRNVLNHSRCVWHPKTTRLRLNIVEDHVEDYEAKAEHYAKYYEMKSLISRALNQTLNPFNAGHFLNT